MVQYINKSTLVVEIERRLADNKKDIERVSHKNLEDYFEGYEDALALFKQQFLDALEVKDVDINKEISQFIDANFKKATIGHKLSLRRTAKHFFELGMTVSNKSQI